MSRDPQEVATDRAYGASGGLCLLLGFLGQLLGSADIGASGRSTTLVSALVAFNLGLIFAFIVYGATYLALRSELRWMARQPHFAEFVRFWRYEHRPRFPWFWHHEVTRQDDATPPA